jgi:hypothetical protein
MPVRLTNERFRDNRYYSESARLNDIARYDNWTMIGVAFRREEHRLKAKACQVLWNLTS